MFAKQLINEINTLIKELKFETTILAGMLFWSILVDLFIF